MKVNLSIEQNPPAPRSLAWTEGIGSPLVVTINAEVTWHIVGFLFSPFDVLVASKLEGSREKQDDRKQGANKKLWRPTLTEGGT